MRRKPILAAAAMAAAVALPSIASADEARIADAMSGAPPQVAETAVIMDWDGTVLRDGNGPFVCLPTPPDMVELGTAPHCLDEEWMAFLEAWVAEDESYRPSQVGIAYMLEGDVGTSNIDPSATEPTPHNHWIVEGPHVMILLPDPAALEALPTDPYYGGPYVMFPGSPFAHIMIPTGERPEQPMAAAQ